MGADRLHQPLSPSVRGIAAVTYGRRGVDGSALLLAVALHGLLLALLLLFRIAPSPIQIERPLSVFDVPLPPPPPPIEPAPAPPPRPDRVAGGSLPPAAGPPVRLDAAVQPLAPPSPPSPPMASPFDDALGLATLPGTGVGNGRGEGAGSGVGNGAGGGPPRYARAEWIRQPTVADVLPYLSARMRRDRVGGRVELGCLVPKPGRPKRCWLISERPKGVGLGRAVLAMWPLFRIRPIHRDDEPLDIPVIVPVEIVAAGGATPKAP